MTVRVTQLLMRTVGLLTVLVTVSALPASGQDFSGRYTTLSNVGAPAQTLVVVQNENGEAQGTWTNSTFFGFVLFDEEDGEPYLEGTVEGPDFFGEFELSLLEDDGLYVMLVTPQDESGTPRLDQVASIRLHRTGDVPDGFGPTMDAAGMTSSNRAHADAGSRRATELPTDAASHSGLVGVWSTQVNMVSEVGSIATELVMEFRADGVLIDHGSRSMASFPDAGLDTGSTQRGEAAYWRTRDDILEVSYDGSQWAQLARFGVDATRLLLVYYDGDRKLWYRR